MKLAIPKVPRPVRLRQVPGAQRRLLGAALVASAAVLAVAVGAARAGRWFSAEADFLREAVEVSAQVQSVALPPFEQRATQPAHLTVLYSFGGADRSVSGVPAAAERAEGWGLGARIQLLVDPKAPEAPREAEYARSQTSWKAMGAVATGLAALLALLWIAWEVRRALRSELAPLRDGMLVWLTADEPVAATRGDVSFRAHYFQQDVRREVRARARPGRAPVRNAEKMLAAVVPSQPSWVRVIDEDLARTLGWYAP